MRPQVLLVAMAVLAVLVALPLGKAHEEEEGADATRKRWPCCDECGICTRSMPPICKCEDKSTSGYHPACKQCVMSWDSNAGAFVSQCNDMIVNFCKRRCTRRPADADDDA